MFLLQPYVKPPYHFRLCCHSFGLVAADGIRTHVDLFMRQGWSLSSDTAILCCRKGRARIDGLQDMYLSAHLTRYYLLHLAICDSQFKFDTVVGLLSSCRSPPP